MMEQAELFAPDIVQIRDASLTNEQRFQRFHELNPWVFTMLAKMLEEKRVQGYRAYGINAIIEEFRWKGTLRTVGEPYKINNTYAPFYARMIRDRYPWLGNMLRFKEQRTP